MPEETEKPTTRRTKKEMPSLLMAWSLPLAIVAGGVIAWGNTRRLSNGQNVSGEIRGSEGTGGSEAPTQLRQRKAMRTPWLRWLQYGSLNLNEGDRLEDGERAKELRQELVSPVRVDLVTLMYGIVAAFLVAFLALAFGGWIGLLESHGLSRTTWGAFAMVGLWMVAPILIHSWQLLTRRGAVQWERIRRVFLIDVAFAYLAVTVLMVNSSELKNGMDALGFIGSVSVYVFAGPLIIYVLGDVQSIPRGMSYAEQKELRIALKRERESLEVRIARRHTAGVWAARGRKARVALCFLLTAAVSLFLYGIWRETPKESNLPLILIAVVICACLLVMIRVQGCHEALNSRKELDLYD